nr:MAG TPA: repressor domain protein [Caudoviricetes sp.]
MNELQIFNNEEFGEVRMIEIDGKPYFVATDVATALGYTNPRKAVNDHCKGVTKRDTPTSSGVQSMSYINEGDLYRLIMKSKLPSAEKFERWVMDEVLPSIRKTGGYNKPMTTSEQIKLLAQGNTELSERMDRLENDMPLYGCEIDEIQSHVKRKAVNILGGKQSNAYKDASTRNKVFADMWNQLKREYGCVSTYKSIKRKYIADVHDFIDCYELPRILEEEVHDCNAQIRMELRD